MEAFFAGFEKRARDEHSDKLKAGAGAATAGALGGYGAYRHATSAVHRFYNPDPHSARHALNKADPKLYLHRLEHGTNPTHMGRRVAAGVAGTAAAGGLAYAALRHLQKKRGDAPKGQETGAS